VFVSGDTPTSRVPVKRPVVNMEGERPSLLSRFVHYGPVDLARDVKDYSVRDLGRDVNRATRVATGASATTIGKAWLDPFHPSFWTKGKTTLSPREQRERDLFAENIMAFHGVGAGLAPVRGAGRVAARKAVASAAVNAPRVKASPAWARLADETGTLSLAELRSRPWYRGDVTPWKHGEFDLAKTDEAALWGPGLYLTDNPRVAGGDSGYV